MDESSSSRHHKHRDKDRESKSSSSKKRHHGDEERSHKSSSKKPKRTDDKERHHSSSTSKHKSSRHSKRSDDEKNGLTVIEDDGDKDMWEEKDITVGGERVRLSFELFLR